MQTVEELLSFSSFIKLYKINLHLVNRIEQFVAIPKANAFIERVYEVLYPEDTIKSIYRLTDSHMLIKELPHQLEQLPNRNVVLDELMEDAYAEADQTISSKAILEIFNDSSYYLSDDIAPREYVSINNLISSLSGIDQRFLITCIIIDQYKVFKKEEKEILVDYEYGQYSAINMIYQETSSIEINKKIIRTDLIEKLKSLGFEEKENSLVLDFSIID